MVGCATQAPKPISVEPTPPILLKPVSLHISDAKAETALKIIEKQLGVPITVDWGERKDLAQNPSLNIDLNNVSLKRILKHLAEQAAPGTTWAVGTDQKGVWIGPLAKAPRIRRTYDLSAFLKHMDSRWSEDAVPSLAALCHRHAKGSPPPVVTDRGKGRFEIVMRHEDHAEFIRLINGFWELKRSQNICLPVSTRRLELEKIIQAKLKKPSAIMSTRLDDALDQWSSTLGINLMIHWRALALAGIEHDQAVSTFSPRRLNGREMLEHILQKAGGDAARIQYLLDHNVVRVSTSACLSKYNMGLRWYNIQAVLKHSPLSKDFNDEEQMQAMADLIRNTNPAMQAFCATGSINEFGGMFLIQYDRKTLDDVATGLRRLIQLWQQTDLQSGVWSTDDNNGVKITIRSYALNGLKPPSDSDAFEDWLQKLLDENIRSIAPNTWDTVGAINFIPNVIIIRQTPTNHEKIYKRLKRLQAVAGN